MTKNQSKIKTADGIELAIAEVIAQARAVLDEYVMGAALRDDMGALIALAEDLLPHAGHGGNILEGDGPKVPTYQELRALADHNVSMYSDAAHRAGNAEADLVDREAQVARLKGAHAADLKAHLVKRQEAEAERDEARTDADARFAHSDHKAAKYYRQWRDAHQRAEALGARIEVLADEWESTYHPRERGCDMGHINGLCEAAGHVRRALDGPE